MTLPTDGDMGGADEPAKTRIFVSFRNGDSPLIAAFIAYALADRFGRDAVFRSSESLRAGQPFAETIWKHHTAAAVVVAVIGARWRGIRDGSGALRLLQEGDWVREEIARAFAQGKVVLPVLVDEAPRFGDRDELPEDLRPLIGLQSLVLGHRQFRQTIEVLGDRIAELVEPAGASRPEPAGTPDWLDAWNLHDRAHPFIEREDLLAALHEQLSAANSDSERVDFSGGRTVVLHGGAGTGKTQLAIEYAHRFSDDYRFVWRIAAEPPELIPAQLAELAREAGAADERSAQAALPSLFRRLRRRRPWLLILDGCENPGAVGSLLAHSGGAHVLITSRVPDWGLLPVTRCPVPGFTREQSLGLLTVLLPSAPADELGQLAAALGDLPLALAQAAVYLTGAPLSAAQYADLVQDRSRELLAQGQTYSYPGTLAAAWSVGLERLRATAPDGAALLELLSVFAGAAIPFAWFSQGLPPILCPPDQPFADPVRLVNAVRAMTGSGLAPAQDEEFRPNPLLQRFVRGGLGPEAVEQLRELARHLVARVPFGDPRAPDAWPRYAPLLPHALALDLAADLNRACRELLIAVAGHLVARADAEAARDLVGPALESWRVELGPDSPLVLRAAEQLAQAYYRLGQYAAAAELDREVLAGQTRLAGPDDPQTLAARHNLAIDQWAAGTDRAATRAALAQVATDRRRILGPAHPDTLRSAHNLALALRADKQYAAAHDLDAENYRLLTEALGPDHPDTQRSVRALALDLRALGEPDLALPLELTAHAHLTATLGPGHPDTLQAAYSAAFGLYTAGETQRAFTLTKETHFLQHAALGVRHPSTLRTTALLGRLTSEIGNRASGEQLSRQVGQAMLELPGRTEPPDQSGPGSPDASEG
jgi:Tetratricopeptide repeat/TIR domain